MKEMRLHHATVLPAQMANASMPAGSVMTTMIAWTCQTKCTVARYPAMDFCVISQVQCRLEHCSFRSIYTCQLPNITVLSRLLADAPLSECASLLEYLRMRVTCPLSSAARNYSIIDAPTDLVIPGKSFPLKETYLK